MYEYAFFAALTILIAILSLASFGLTKAVTKVIRGVVVMALVLGLNLVMLSVSGTPYDVRVTDALQREVNAEILHYVLVENEAIYYWLMPDESLEPFYLKRPWSTNEAQDLTEAFEQARKSGGRLRYEPSLRDPNLPPKFYAPPQEAPPPKDQVPPAKRFEHPGFDA